MRNRQLYIDQLRQSRTLRSIAVIVLWTAMFASIPQIDLHAAYASSEVQKIIPPDSIPAASPAFHIKTTIEYAEFFFIILSKTDLEKHLHITTILDKFLSEHARALISVLIYTQTTSSFL